MAQTGFLDALLAPRVLQGGAPADWLKARRAIALERAGALSVPTTRDEEWRFTDLSALYKLKPQQAAAGIVDAAAIEAYAVPEAATRLVFVDGRFDRQHSCILDSHASFACGLSDALSRNIGALESALAKVARIDTDLFTAINTAFLHDAAVIYVAPGHTVKAAIHVIHVATGNETAAHPRVLVIAENDAACTVVEDFVSIGGASYLTNAVTEIAVAPNAQVRHVKIQREAQSAFHIANTSVRIERNARYRNWSVTLGGRISRHNLSVVQAGNGIDCEVDGLALISGRQLADTHSLIDHAHPQARSRQLHKTVVGGAAHAVFNGKIFVREGAQQTDSAQQSRNLLLTPRAHVDTKPQLEIFADDVKCAHGATVGQIDAEEVFYLKSRGLSEGAARNLLTYAFAAEVVERIPLKSLVVALESAIIEQTRTEVSP